MVGSPNRRSQLAPPTLPSHIFEDNPPPPLEPDIDTTVSVTRDCAVDKLLDENSDSDNDVDD